MIPGTRTSLRCPLMTLAENQTKLSDLTETRSLSWSTQQSKSPKFFPLMLYCAPNTHFHVTFGMQAGFWWLKITFSDAVKRKGLSLCSCLQILICGHCQLLTFTFCECNVIWNLFCCLCQDCSFFQCSPPVFAHLQELWSRKHQGLLYRPAGRILRGQALPHSVFK